MFIFKKSNKLGIKGFTLIELLVVIAIIGILATLIAANLNSARARARDARRKSDLKNIATSLSLYFNDNNYFPLYSAAASNGKLTFSTTSDIAFKSTDGNTTYMDKVPNDPIYPSIAYLYTPLPVGCNNTTVNCMGIELKSCLENNNDQQGITPVAGITCQSGAQRMIVVKQNPS